MGKAQNDTLQIAICDDMSMMADKLTRLVDEIMAKRDISYYIHTLLYGQELLESGEEYDLVFLDIEMPNMDGIEVGKRLKRKYPHVNIIMTSDTQERIKETFIFGAFRFVTKPFVVEELTEAIDAFLNSRIGTEFIEVHKNRNVVKIQQRNIRYVAACDGYTEINVNGCVYRTENSLERLEKELNALLFYRIHRKYIVNMFWIEAYQKSKVSLDTGQELDVSRRKRKEFEMTYKEINFKCR